MSDIHIVGHNKHSQVNSELSSQTLYQYHSEHCLLCEVYLDVHTIFREVVLLSSSDCKFIVRFFPYFISEMKNKISLSIMPMNYNKNEAVTTRKFVYIECNSGNG
jgi:hypothetical protein